MGSTRLPGKVLRDISGKPLLGHVLGRLQMLKRPARVVVATSSAGENDMIEAWCLEHGVSCFRGDEADVLDRYFQCAKSLGMSDIVRLTADNPFTDIEELERLIDLHQKQGSRLHACVRPVADRRWCRDIYVRSPVAQSSRGKAAAPSRARE
ncbi:hypothetical protein V7796_22530 [Rhizobium laguerreae]